MIYKESIGREVTRWVIFGEGRRATKTVAIEHVLTLARHTALAANHFSNITCDVSFIGPLGMLLL